jgi:hypothetical protein
MSAPFLISFLAASAFSTDLQAITMFHSSVAARDLTAANPMPLFAPVTITVLFTFGAAFTIEITDRSKMKKKQTRISFCITATMLIEKSGKHSRKCRVRNNSATVADDSNTTS